MDRRRSNQLAQMLQDFDSESDHWLQVALFAAESGEPEVEEMALIRLSQLAEVSAMGAMA